MALQLQDIPSESIYRAACFGIFGKEYITDSGTSTTGVTYCSITALTETTFTTLTDSFVSGGGGDTDLSAITIPAGATIYGLFTSIEVNTGDILAYRITLDK